VRLAAANACGVYDAPSRTLIAIAWRSDDAVANVERKRGNLLVTLTFAGGSARTFAFAVRHPSSQADASRALRDFGAELEREQGRRAAASNRP
jgi:hypothetical protein